jgi:hypothetical protein
VHIIEAAAEAAAEAEAGGVYLLAPSQRVGGVTDRAHDTLGKGRLRSPIIARQRAHEEM